MFLKSLLLISFVYCYQEGSQGHKWMKRWLAPGIAAVLFLLILFLNQELNLLTILGSLGFLAASNGFSYGEKFTKNKTVLKVLFRGLCGLSFGVCGLLIGIGIGHYRLGIAQALIATASSIAFGVFNPYPSSWGNAATRAEDICISFFYIFLPIWML